MVTIFFESHATTIDNEAKVASGWYDVELSELGEKQARDLGERYQNQHLDAVFCSDLRRSYETARLAFGDAFPIIQDKRLRECDYGDLTRIPMPEVEKVKEEMITKPFPNGESFEDTSKRMKSFLHDLLGEYDGKAVMIIGHRATQYGLDEHIKGMPLKEAVLASWRWQPGWLYHLSSLD